MEFLLILILAFIAVNILNNRKQKPSEEITLKNLRTFGRRETR